MRKSITMIALTVLTIAPARGAQPSFDDAEAECRVLVGEYLARYRPLWMDAAKAWWVSSTTGSDEAFAAKKAADQALADLHADKDLYARAKALRDGGQVRDPVLRRELEVMYNELLRGQADPAIRKRIIELESDVDKIFNTHRSEVGGQTLTENDVRAILKDSTDSARCEAAWKGYMEVGRKADQALRELVALRNELARQLGFKNYYVMQLSLQEIDEQKFLALFDELAELTRPPFAEVKAKIDAERAARFGVPVAELRPWHFGDLFFQESPGAGGGPNLDELYAQADILDLTRRYYASIGLPCEDILERSDLYEKPGKSPHAFCTDLDREGDVRVLCNIKPNLYWADTVLHEVGHAVYDKHLGRDVPFLLRTASHSITTEGAAMMFGAFVKNEEWLTRVVGVDPARAREFGRAAKETLRTEKLIFSRWTQVMVRFEYGMYSDPEQDLGKLWWDLKKRYQMLNPPETTARPDYAAKIHVLSAPVYYHSYQMGDLFASQVKHHVATKILKQDPLATSFYDRPEAGEYLREQIFAPANLYSWNDLTQRATGEPLTAKYFAAEFVR